MLLMFNPLDTTCNEVNMNQAIPEYHLVNPDLLRTLMERTKTGDKITIRELADRVGVAHGTIHNLLTRKTTKLPAPVAYSIASVIGVDVLILWTPLGRDDVALETYPGALEQVPA
jgi:lambda repressor-like predicted transcriptional regulator